MERIQEILTTIDNWLWGNWLLFVLLAIEAGIASFWSSVAGSLLKICLAAW